MASFMHAVFWFFSFLLLSVAAILYSFYFISHRIFFSIRYHKIYRRHTLYLLFASLVSYISLMSVWCTIVDSNCASSKNNQILVEKKCDREEGKKMQENSVESIRKIDGTASSELFECETKSAVCVCVEFVVGLPLNIIKCHTEMNETHWQKKNGMKRYTTLHDNEINSLNSVQPTTIRVITSKCWWNEWSHPACNLFILYSLFPL